MKVGDSVAQLEIVDKVTRKDKCEYFKILKSLMKLELTFNIFSSACVFINTFMDEC